MLGFVLMNLISLRGYTGYLSSLDFHMSENCTMFAKLILALKHHPWISSKLNERTKTMNCFIVSPLKMSSSAWAFLAAKTTLQE